MLQDHCLADLRELVEAFATAAVRGPMPVREIKDFVGGRTPE